jgi:hypothetical protein
MSTSPESGSQGLELDLDLQFLPAWAQKPPAENKYAKYEGGGEDRPQRRGDRPERRDQRRDGPPRRDQGRPGQPPPRGGFTGGPRRNEERSGREGDFRREERREPAPPPIEVNVSFIPEEKGVESLARQIRLTGRAYPLFDIGFLILRKPDRYHIRFSVIKKPDGQTAQPLFVCGLDETLWLTEQEAIDYVLSKHFATFYQAERIATEPPKGTYTFVAQCGMSGVILGPPNYHDYQNKVRKLHTERFSRMPFEVFKARIKIVRDEAVVKKWQDDQSWKTQYICLNVPESVTLPNREEVEKHFRETHLANVIKSVESHTLIGTAAQASPSRGLQQLVRRSWDELMRFPLKMVNVLSQQFAGHGLQFFKVSKTITHVAVARPHYLDLEVTPVSDGIRRIVECIGATANCSRRKILAALAPTASLQPATPAAAGAPAADAAPPTPEAAAVISDLHWLIHQGHVIEFANGLIELAKKPILKPLKPEPAPIAPAADAPKTNAEPSAPPSAVSEANHETQKESVVAPPVDLVVTETGNTSVVSSPSGDSIPTVAPTPEVGISESQSSPSESAPEAKPEPV